ncbi:ABC transporter permease [Gracilimonas mengyeensis]|uniref:Putative ABC transport system permease protein n=1 Tax=Gracilimonas mengyeensis TaxID=1302730 RepID=A0A521E974_9BACT|nr:ABC transporter permease [Gracilimonas mengyeensis]SMO80463.1 putative ABC transport system permease protein [Gracilimonas mengyeensis]
MRILNSFTEGFKIAFGALRTNKIRSTLTALCIIIGITMVTIVDAVTTGMDVTFEKSMAMMGQNVVYVEKWPWGMGGEYKWWEYRNRREMKMEYVDRIRDYSELAEHVAASASRYTNIRYQEKTAENVGLNGATSNYLELQGLDIAEGRMFVQEEVRSGSKVAVIGHSLMEALFEFENPLGKQIRVGGQRFTVVGVLEKQGKFLGLEDTDNRIIIPISAYEHIYGLRSGIQIGVQFPDEQTLREGEYELEGIMRRIRQVEATEDNDFALNKPEAFKEQLEGMKAGIYAVGFILSGLSLLIGGIGVMNIMFVSVRERTKEIGIRKAVGAKAWEILTQFLLEAIAICLLGGIIGVALAGIITVLINEVFVAVMNVGVVFLGFSICTIVGVIFGFIPAYRAAKSDPIESLRFE